MGIQVRGGGGEGRVPPAMRASDRSRRGRRRRQLLKKAPGIGAYVYHTDAAIVVRFARDALLRTRRILLASDIVHAYLLMLTH